MFKIKVVHGVNENLVDDIVRIDRDSFPAGWEHGDAKEYFSEILKNENNIRIILKDEGIAVGYLVAVPHNDARRDLQDDDQFIQEDAFRYYIESVAILPAYQGKKGFFKMFETLIKELKNKGVCKISMHARVLNNFSAIIQKETKVTRIRKIDRWKYYNYEEPTDYIEADL